MANKIPVRLATRSASSKDLVSVNSCAISMQKLKLKSKKASLVFGACGKAIMESKPARKYALKCTNLSKWYGLAVVLVWGSSEKNNMADSQRQTVILIKEDVFIVGNYQ